jgi:adenylate cyclase
VILPYQGTIQELMGDGLLVFFGTPHWQEDDAQRAVACAVAMQAAMATVNETIGREGLPHVEMGIGIHTGEVVVGNIGSYKRTKYGAVGNHVNLAFQIESYTIGGQVLISEATR